MTDASIQADPPPVISRKATRRITYAVLAGSAVGIVVLGKWGDDANAIHVYLVGACVWTFWGTLGARGLAEIVPFLPALRWPGSK